MHKLAAVMLLFATVAAHAAAAREDQVLLQGNIAGKQIVTAAGADRTRVEYRYNDRGRGDEIEAQWRLDSHGVLIDYQARGKNYTKAVVNETFSLRDGRASWKNSSEQGDRSLDAAAFFIPISAPPELQGVLVRALLKAPGQRLALLPSGLAHVETAGTLRIESGNGPVELTHYRVSGLASPLHRCGCMAMAAPQPLPMHPAGLPSYRRNSRPTCPRSSPPRSGPTPTGRPGSRAISPINPRVRC